MPANGSNNNPVVQNESDSPLANAVDSANRRNFLATTSGAMSAGVVLSQEFLSRTAHAAGSDIIKVGLVGCGGRGNGAAGNAMSADPGCRLTGDR